MNSMFITITSGVCMILLNLLTCRFLVFFFGLKDRAKYYAIYLAMTYILRSLVWNAEPLSSTYFDFICNVGIIYLFCRYALKVEHKSAFMLGCLNASIWISLNIFDFSFASILFNVTDLHEITIFSFVNIVHIATISLTYYIFVKRYGIASKYNSNYITIFIVPICFVSLALQTIMSIAYTPVQFHEGGMIGNPSLQHDFEILSLSIVAMICIYTILYTYEQVIEKIETKNNLILLETENSLQRRYIFEAKHKYNSTQSFRHDFKNHIIVLNGMLSKNNITMAKEYLQRFEEIEQTISFDISTNNPVMDILLGEKLALAKKMNIRVSCDVNIDETMRIDDFDLCAIFSNAIDNAVKACVNMSSTNKFIDIVAKRKKDFFVIDIINSYNPEKYMKGDGIGIQTMTLLTEKYSGTIKIEKENAVFRLSILFVLDN